MSISILPSGKNPKHIRQEKKTNEGADEKNEEYYNEPGRVVLPNTRRDQVLPDHVVFNYRRVRVRGMFLEEVLLFSLSLSLFLSVVISSWGAFLASNLCLLIPSLNVKNRSYPHSRCTSTRTWSFASTNFGG